jgi:hypothetical protein
LPTLVRYPKNKRNSTTKIASAGKDVEGVEPTNDAGRNGGTALWKGLAALQKI